MIYKNPIIFKKLVRGAVRKDSITKTMIKNFLTFSNNFSRLCRSLEECITISDNGTQLYRPYQPVI